MKFNGFTLIEVIIATSILLTVVSTVLPITSLLLKEQKILSDRRALSYRLHDELQPYIWDKNRFSPDEFSQTLNGNNVQFKFVTEGEFIKGCASWENAKQIEETFCLYGLPE